MLVGEEMSSKGTYSDINLDGGPLSFGINMRFEMSWIVNNTGWYAGWRKFDLTTRSQYWDEVAKESIGGPPWDYTDYVFKTRRIVPGRTSLENEILARFGTIERESLLYFIPHNIDIKREDWLYSLRQPTVKSPPTKVLAKDIYDVTLIEPKIDGDEIYKVVKVKVRAHINDRTIRGYIPVSHIPV